MKRIFVIIGFVGFLLVLGGIGRTETNPDDLGTGIIIALVGFAIWMIAMLGYKFLNRRQTGRLNLLR